MTDSPLLFNSDVVICSIQQPNDYPND